jgi:hypothetical protein
VTELIERNQVISNTSELSRWRMPTAQECSLLAKLLIQLSLGEYKNGFHIHLRADLSDDAAKLDALAPAGNTRAPAEVRRRHTGR